MPSERYDRYDVDQRHERAVAETISIDNKRQDTEWAVADLKRAAERDRIAAALRVPSPDVSDETDDDATDADATGDSAQPAVDPLLPSLAELLLPPVPDLLRPLGMRTSETPASDRSPPPDGADPT